MEELELTNWYVNKIKDIAGAEGKLRPAQKVFAALTASPFWTIDKGIQAVRDMNKLLKNTMYSSRENSREYAENIFQITMNTMGGGSLTSKADAEALSSLLGMNKGDALAQWAKSGANAIRKTTKEYASRLSEVVDAPASYTLVEDASKETIKTMREGLASVYRHLESRVEQKEFDWINDITADIPQSGRLGTVGEFYTGSKSIRVHPDIGAEQEMLNTTFHELTHAGQYSGGSDILPSGKSYKEASGELFGELNKAYEATNEMLNQGELSSFSEMKNIIYRNYDPTEAMARAVGKEMSQTKETQFKDIFEAYLDRFIADKEKGVLSHGGEYSSGKEGFTNYERYFQDVFAERKMVKAMEKTINQFSPEKQAFFRSKPPVKGE